MIRRFLIPGLAVLALTAGACGGGGRAAGGIDHPKGAEDLLVRIEHAGGLMIANGQLTQLPIVSLFGDGLYVVGGPQIEIYPGPALPNLLSRKVKESGIQAILAAADEAGLTKGSRKLRNPTVADAGSTVFTVNVRGKRYVVEAEALGLGGGEDPAFRTDLEEFRDLLTDLTRWLPSNAVSAETPYGSAGLRIVVEPYQSPDEGGPQQPKAWPLDQPLSEFGAARNLGIRCGAVRGDDLRKVLALAREANQLTPWRSGGKEYLLRFRPLLPDESGC